MVLLIIMSVLDYVDLSQTAKLTDQDNILCTSVFTYEGSYASLDVYTHGINEFIKIKSNFKLVVFHDASIPAEIIQRWNKSPKIVLCKFDFSEVFGNQTGLLGTIVRYLPMFTNEFKFNYGSIVDSDRHSGQWRRDFSMANAAMGTDQMVYNIPLAGELLTRNIAARNHFPLKGWYRISAHPVIFKCGNPLPLDIINTFLFETIKTPEYNEVVNYILQYEYEKAHPNQGKFVYGCDELFLLNVMKYHEDTKTPYLFTVNVYTHRSPFYYWLEHVRPDENKQLEFLRRVGTKKDSVRDFLAIYDNTKRQELYDLINEKFGSDLSFFEDQSVIDCINRFIAYNHKNFKSLYQKSF